MVTIRRCFTVQVLATGPEPAQTKYFGSSGKKLVAKVFGPLYFDDDGNGSVLHS